MKALTRFQMYMVLVIIATGAICWTTIHNFPVFGPFDYLNQLYYVFWHEGMHATTTVLTFGSVEQMMVMHRLGGYVYSRGAGALLVFPAGYIGPVLLSCIVLYRSVKYPQHSDFLAFAIGVASMLIAGVFTTTDPLLRLFSVGFVIINVVLFLVKATSWRLGFLTYIIVGLCAVVLFLQQVHTQNDDGANLTFLVGITLGGVLTFVGATGRVFPSLVVLSLVNSSLLYNSITRATEMVPQVQAGVQNDPAMLAAGLGWSPLFMATLWMSIIVLICIVTTIVVMRVIAQSH